MIEELRIGAADGPDHLMFGQITAIAVRSTGEILIHDGQANALRRFGPDGTYRGTLYRQGSGPGEYRGVAGLAVLPDDRLVMHDFGNRRFNIYSADTTLVATWALRTNVAEWRPVYSHDAGSIYLYDRIRRDGTPIWTPILVRIDVRGQPGDTTALPVPDRETPSLSARAGQVLLGANIPFHAQSHWSVTSAGDLVTADGARYAIHVRRRDGTVLRIAREPAAVPVSEEERTAEKERITAQFRRDLPTWSWDGPPIPSTKPPISWLHTGLDGTLWVRVARAGKPVPSSERTRGAESWVREPIVFDVFSADGRYAGETHAPDYFQLAPYPVIRGDQVWAVIRDKHGVNYVARFRIERE